VRALHFAQKNDMQAETAAAADGGAVKYPRGWNILRINYAAWHL